MPLSIIKDWLVPVSTAVSILSVAIGVVLSLVQYRLKLKAETRLAASAQVESDIKLLKLFTEIMNIANARGESMVSEKLMELLARRDMPGLKDQIGSKDIRQAAVITLPIGAAAQDAAIAAICELGRRHDLLRPVAVRALESLCAFKAEVAQRYLDDLRENG